jgi:F0F1-type ATP synthase membrane subunit c/vacuolar-type H+-ATPase subunit K
MFLPCWVFAACGKSSIAALGRNPSAAPKILQSMIIVLIFAEAAVIIALLVAFQLFS